jgi:Sulfotransferase domain
MKSFSSRVAALSYRLRRPETPAVLERFEPDAERDIFLVTYPRSGTTWISCLAAELLFQISPTNLTAINSMVPDVHDLPEKSTVPAASQNLIKSHCPLNAVHGFPPFGKYRKVIDVIRDPRDVILCCPIIATPGIYRIILLRRFERIRDGLGRGTHMALLLAKNTSIPGLRLAFGWRRSN